VQHQQTTISFCMSSRRRHTRFSRDWSSDVCSSDLCRVERESLVLGELQADGLELAQPGRAAQLAAAATHATQECGLVPYTDLLELDARAERAGEVANQLAEVDAPLCREVDRQRVAAGLPLRFADLHL